MTSRGQAVASEQDLSKASRLATRLEDWYAENGRTFPWRNWHDPYRIAVVEILLQRTPAASVVRTIGPFLSSYPTPTVLAAALESSVELHLTPLGLQRRKASVLVAMAQVMVSSPETPWADWPGVGQYVARALDVNVEHVNAAMVDSNFVRVLRRVFPGGWMADYRHDRRLQALAAAVVREAEDSRKVNWAVLDLGATVCKARTPECHRCPLIDECATGSGRLTSEGLAASAPSGG